MQGLVVRPPLRAIKNTDVMYAREAVLMHILLLLEDLALYAGCQQRTMQLLYFQLRNLSLIAILAKRHVTSSCSGVLKRLPLK